MVKCPECSNGEHRNCNSVAQDPETFDLVTCECWGNFHQETLSHNIFDKAESVPITLDRVVVAKWIDGSEQVFGPYSMDSAMMFGLDLLENTPNIHSFTIKRIV